MQENPNVQILHTCTTIVWPFSRQTDLPLPRALRQAQLLNQILPPRSASLLPAQIPQQLLPPMHQQPQVPLPILILRAPALQELIQTPDLRRQDRDLHLATPRVGARARRLLGERVRPAGRRRRFGRQDGVGGVPAEVLDAAHLVDAQAVVAAGEAEGADTAQGLLGGGLLGSAFRFLLFAPLADLGGGLGFVAARQAQGFTNIISFVWVRSLFYFGFWCCFFWRRAEPFAVRQAPFELGSGKEEVEMFILFRLRPLSVNVRRSIYPRSRGCGRWRWLGGQGGIEGFDVGGGGAADGVAEGCSTLLLQDLLPAEVGGFAGFGLGDGVGIAVFASMSALRCLTRSGGGEGPGGGGGDGGCERSVLGRNYLLNDHYHSALSDTGRGVFAAA